MAENGEEKRKRGTNEKENSYYKYWILLSIPYAFSLFLMHFIPSAINYECCKPKSSQREALSLRRFHPWDFP
jgi:hypothetical protein